MMRSLSMAIASLRNHQIYMDVISSNIANVNTTGYKSSRISFQELLSQTIRGSSAPRGGLGGLNPVQIGLGVALGGIDSLFTQGNLQDTGKLTDISIQGDGFFVLNSGDGYKYARDGNLDIGLDGELLHLATGYKVMGWAAEEDGTIDTTQPLENISVPFGQRLARATSEMTLRGNLQSDGAVGDNVPMTMAVYDSQGGQHDVTITFTKAGDNQWTWNVSWTDPDIGGITPAGNNVTFLPDGTFDPTNPDSSMVITLTNGAETPATVDLDLSQLTQMVGIGEINVSNQNGLAPGSLTTFNLGITGEVNGVFSNGLTRRLGQIATATFLNPGGLTKEGQSLFATSANSGAAQVGAPAQDGRGQISSGYLEMSNVDLAMQFTGMIVAQRGFQANSRVITASDEMLQELVNLVR